jgi:hypothetical protein
MPEIDFICRIPVTLPWRNSQCKRIFVTRQAAVGGVAVGGVVVGGAVVGRAAVGNRTVAVIAVAAVAVMNVTLERSGALVHSGVRGLPQQLVKKTTVTP